MSNKKVTNVYDDDNIPEVDLPQDCNQSSNREKNDKNSASVLTQSTKDNLGGE